MDLVDIVLSYFEKKVLFGGDESQNVLKLARQTSLTIFEDVPILIY